MGLSRSQGITRNVTGYGNNDRGITPGSAYEKSIEQMGRFNTISLNKYGSGNKALDDVTYGYSSDQLKEEMNLDHVTDAADQLKEYGDSLFSIFDKYQGNFDYLGDNAGVSDAELANRLGESSSQFSAGTDASQREHERNLQRMGVNPNSAKFAGFGTSNALQKAAGLSMLQNKVRKDARDESWKENMDVAQFGMAAGNAGVNAVSTAANAYGQSGKLFIDQKLKFDQLNEGSRQFNANYGLNQDALKLKAQGQAFDQGLQRWDKGIVQSVNGNPYKNPSIGYDYGF